MSNPRTARPIKPQALIRRTMRRIATAMGVKHPFRPPRHLPPRLRSKKARIRKKYSEAQWHDWSAAMGMRTNQPSCPQMWINPLKEPKVEIWNKRDYP